MTDDNKILLSTHSTLTLVDSYFWVSVASNDDEGSLSETVIIITIEQSYNTRVFRRLCLSVMGAFDRLNCVCMDRLDTVVAMMIATS